MIKSLQLKGVFWIAVATWWLSLYISGEPLNIALLKPAGLTLAVVTAVVAIFERYLWRLKVLHPWLISTPDLNGTYKGEISSKWIDPTTNENPPAIEAYLSIRQGLSGITVRMMTKESRSISLVASICFDEDGKADLIFNYRNEPFLPVQNRSRMHHGASRLAIDGKDDSRLQGSYWTDRNTFGEIELSRISRKQTRSFKEAEDLSKESTK